MTERLLLSDICEEFFGVTERVAIRKASLGLLPVPAFRLTGTRKGPLFVLRGDLDDHVNRQRDKAYKLNCKMREAGLV